MSAPRGDIAFAGQRVKQKILIALVLSSFIPLLILAYILYAHILPLLTGETNRLVMLGLQVLLLFTGLLMAAGAYVIWDVAAAVARTAEIIDEARPSSPLSHRSDEIGTLMQGFSRMLGTIESQAQEINTFAGRLDAAYKELETTNSRLKEFSFKDDVTGLYNRRFFSIRLEEEISRYRRFNHPVSVVLLDLDGFKDVNDRLGHAAGDEILRDIAQILLKHSRGINVISRYGGDEFAVLLVETPKAGARLYADRIRQVVSTYPFSHGCRITASFGVSSLPEDVAAAPDDIVKTADEALYAAKRAGKNKVAGYEQVAGDRPVESGKQG
ncbi:MAG TPA: GGDEF domain-containing protein [Candidatus Polarisedimenticolia bacterium]|nr:GGDEF domain-containing protein [Candidatus Polarisedimenticolia bacterium]